VTTKAASFVVPLPSVTAMPVTSDSHPWLYHKLTQRPLDLEKFGFVEEEFLVRGTANVYDWPADPAQSLIVKYSNAPYATRVLVRRPADLSKFSGTVIVEVMNPARGFDMAIMHGFLSEHVLEQNAAWIGISTPGVLDSLKRFDPTRYSALSFANPAPASAACAGGRGGRGRAGATPAPPVRNPWRAACVWTRSPRWAAGSNRTSRVIPWLAPSGTSFWSVIRAAMWRHTSARWDAMRAWKTASRYTTATSRTAGAAPVSS
jgi:hypothetical protein